LTTFGLLWLYWAHHFERIQPRSRRIMKKKKYFQMSELSKHSGVPKSRIRYYISRNILAQPIKINKTTSLYTHEHLEQLNIIRELRQKKKLPLAAVKKSMSSVSQKEIGKEAQLDPSQIIRNQVIDLSVEVFRRKGYEKVTISDITQAAGISRNTFYQVFKNKKELFITCLTKLFLEWRQAAPHSKTPIPSVMMKMALSHYQVYPRWNDMMNIFRAAATKYPDDFAGRLEEALRIRIGPIVTDIETGVKQGEIRNLNAELAAIMYAGQLDYVCYFMSRGAFGNIAPSIIIDQMLDIFFNGTKKS
jgi:AcrR family transcriptional regulator